MDEQREPRPSAEPQATGVRRLRRTRTRRIQPAPIWSSRTSRSCSPRRKERDEYLELARRTKADFENYRKRAAGETSRGRAPRHGRTLARELVPVLDNLERALAAAGIDPEAPEADDDGAGLAHGVLLVYRDLRATLERAGVETYDPAESASIPTGTRRCRRAPPRAPSPGPCSRRSRRATGSTARCCAPARVIVSE